MSDPAIDAMYPDEGGWYGKGRTPQEPNPYLKNLYDLAGKHPGLVEGGNIDLSTRPNHLNPDGSISSVRSMGINVEGKEVLVPTVADDGHMMSDDEAEAQYRHTGRKFGQFESPAASDEYANLLHLQQANNQPRGDYGPQRVSRQNYGDIITAMMAMGGRR
jgi:hypothetical protein